MQYQNRLSQFLIFGAILAVFFFFAGETEAAYRKPPFNGSIFGKRGQIDYDSAGKALSAMCEIANEACQTWFPAADNK